jgi:hemerythrin
MRFSGTKKKIGTTQETNVPDMELTRHRELIDRDHVDLASIVAQVRRAIDAQDFRLAKQLLLDLQRLEEAHYASEAALMRAAGLDMPAPHRAEHAELIDTLRSINHTLLIENLHSISPRVAAHVAAALEHMHKSDLELWVMLADANSASSS